MVGREEVRQYLLIKNTDEMKQWLLKYSNLPLNGQTLQILASIEMENLVESKLKFMKENNLNQDEFETLLLFNNFIFKNN